jgi:hypothetical protein
MDKLGQRAARATGRSSTISSRSALTSNELATHQATSFTMTAIRDRCSLEDFEQGRLAGSQENPLITSLLNGFVGLATIVENPLQSVQPKWQRKRLLKAAHENQRHRQL